MSMWALSRNRGNGLFSVHHFAAHMLMNSMRIYARTTEWILKNRERKKMNEKNGTILVRAVNRNVCRQWRKRKHRIRNAATVVTANYDDWEIWMPYLVRSDGTHSPVSHLSVVGCYLLSALLPVDLFEAREANPKDKMELNFSMLPIDNAPVEQPNELCVWTLLTCKHSPSEMVCGKWQPSARVKIETPLIWKMIFNRQTANAGLKSTESRTRLPQIKIVNCHFCQLIVNEHLNSSQWFVRFRWALSRL